MKIRMKLDIYVKINKQKYLALVKLSNNKLDWLERVEEVNLSAFPFGP